MMEMNESESPMQCRNVERCLSKPGYKRKPGISLDVNWNTGKTAAGIEGA